MEAEDSVTMVAKADADTFTEIHRKDVVGNTLREVSRKRQSLSDLFTIVGLLNASFCIARGLQIFC
jgi:hypothetical protein